MLIYLFHCFIARNYFHLFPSPPSSTLLFLITSENIISEGFNNFFLCPIFFGKEKFIKRISDYDGNTENMTN